MHIRKAGVAACRATDSAATYSCRSAEFRAAFRMRAARSTRVDATVKAGNANAMPARETAAIGGEFASATGSDAAVTAQ